MQALKYLEDSFNSLSLRIKIELFILPLLLLGVLTFFITKPNIKNNVVNKIDIIEKIKTVKMKEKIVTIIKNIEIYANENLIKINSISSFGTNIKIELYANKKEQIKFIKFLEDYNSFSKIKTLLIKQKNLNLELSFQKIYLKEELNLEKRIEKIEEKKDVNLKLYAIVGKKVLLNDKWLGINESFNEYELTKIKINSVFLDSGFEIIKLNIYKNEIKK